MGFCSFSGCPPMQFRDRERCSLRLSAAEHFATLQYIFVLLQLESSISKVATTDEHQIAEIAAPLPAEGGGRATGATYSRGRGVTTRRDIAPREAAIDQLGGPDLRHHLEDGAAADKTAHTPKPRMTSTNRPTPIDSAAAARWTPSTTSTPIAWTAETPVGTPQARAGIGGA